MAPTRGFARKETQMAGTTSTTGKVDAGAVAQRVGMTQQELAEFLQSERMDGKEQRQVLGVSAAELKQLAKTLGVQS
jgi:hypothetical protein